MVRASNGKAVHVTQSVQQPGTIRFDFLPKTAGTYRVSVTAGIDDEPVPGQQPQMP